MAIVALLCTLLEYHLLIYFLQSNGYHRHLEQLVWPVHPPDEGRLHSILTPSNRRLATVISSSRCHRQVWIAFVGLLCWVPRRIVLVVEIPAAFAAYRCEHDQPSRYIWVAYTLIMCSMVQICAFLCRADGGCAFHGPYLHIGSTCTSWRALDGDGSSMSLPCE